MCASLLYYPQVEGKLMEKVNFLAWKEADGRPQSTWEADTVNASSILAPSLPAGLELRGTARFPGQEVMAEAMPQLTLQKSPI